MAGSVVVSSGAGLVLLASGVGAQDDDDDDLDTLVISRGLLHRNSESTGSSAETLIVGRGDRRGSVDINLGRRGHIQVDSDMDGDVVLMGDDVFIDKNDVIDGDAVAIGGSVTILGTVLGDAVAIGGNLILGDSAVVSGDVVSVGGGVTRPKGARVGGEVVNVGVSLPFLGGVPKSRTQSTFLDLVRWMVFYLIVFAAAALAIYLARDRIGYASAYLAREPVPSFLLGLVSPFMALVAFILLCITVIGILPAVALIFLYPVFMFLGWVVTGHRIGSAVGHGGPAVTVRTVFIGLLVISGIHMFNVLVRVLGIGGLPLFLVQVAGFTVSFTSALVGLGAIIGTRFRRPPEPIPQGMSYPVQGGPPPVYPPAPPVTPYPPAPPSGALPPGSAYAPPAVSGMSPPSDPGSTQG
jgi:hypothetical protein